MTKDELEQIIGEKVHVDGYLPRVNPLLTYIATVDGQEEWGSGYGQTEAQALGDLYDKLYEAALIGETTDD